MGGGGSKTNRTGKSSENLGVMRWELCTKKVTPKRGIGVPAGSKTGGRNPIRRLLNPRKTQWGCRGKRKNASYIMEAESTEFAK